MKKILMTCSFVLFCLMASQRLWAGEIIDSKLNNEPYQIGVMVKDIQAALMVPYDKQSLQTIAHYGTDSRYYMMIRGWLFQELISAESQLYATKKASEKVRFQKRSNFLKKAIRSVDLE